MCKVFMFFDILYMVCIIDSNTKVLHILIMVKDKISFDLWAVGVLEALIHSKGLLLPPPILFRDGGMKEIIAQVKSVVPAKEWNEDQPVDSQIQESVETIFYWITTTYIEAAFNKGWGKFAPLGKEKVAGENEIFFFLLSFIVRSGVIGTPEDAKVFLQTNDRMRVGYAPYVHTQKVEELFIFEKDFV